MVPKARAEGQDAQNSLGSATPYLCKVGKSLSCSLPKALISLAQSGIQAFVFLNVPQMMVM